MKNELRTMAGRYEQLIGKLQIRYRDAREKARRQEVDFAKIVLQLRQANARLEALLARLRRTRPVAGREPKRNKAAMLARSRREVPAFKRPSARRLA